VKSAAALATLLASALAVPLSPANTASSVAATPTCHGKPATIVGVPEQVIRGTSGRDVIVSNGAPTIRALEGADTICVTRLPSQLWGGPGDDWVRADQPVDASLGAGNDTFIGSPGNDLVWDDRRYAKEGRDQISVGSGRDRVYVDLGQGSGSDIVDLGPDDDQLSVLCCEGALPARPQRYTGGDGRDYLRVPPVPHERIDTAAGTILSGEVLVARLDHFEKFVMHAYDGPVFRGSSADERINLQGTNADVSMRGGADVVRVVRPVPGQPWARLDLGMGRDRLWLHGSTNQDAEVDLAKGELRSPAGVFTVSGVEDLTTSNWHAFAAYGTAAGNRIEIVETCAGSAYGRGGDDHLEFTGAVSGTDCSRVGHGGPGGDTLVGTSLADELYGDEGYDRVHGGGGHDICEAEVVDCPA